MHRPWIQNKVRASLTGAAFGGTKLSISFLVMRPSGPEPEQKTPPRAPYQIFYHSFLQHHRNNSCSSNNDLITVACLRLGHLPPTCARSIPFSAASFLASGLANTRPFLGAAGAAGVVAGLGGAAAAAAAGAAAWNINANVQTWKSRLYKASSIRIKVNSSCCWSAVGTTTT